MGVLFSSAELAPEKYWGKWTHIQKQDATYGAGGEKVKYLIIQPAGTVQSKGTITNSDGTTTSYDTGPIAVTGWKVQGPSVVYGGLVTGISKRLEITPLGQMHVLSDESAESMCAGSRSEVGVSETYRKL